jgi:uncharacterized protein (TIGR03437 family)
MQRLKILPLLLVPCLAVLCLPDTALGQVTLTVTDQQNPPNQVSQLTFNLPGSSATQTVVATANVFTTLRIQTDPGSSAWLKVNNAAGTSFVNATPSALLNVSVSTAGLTGQTYVGYFDVMIDNPQQQPKVHVVVTLNLTSSSGLFANPTSLAFTGVQGTGVTSPSGSLLTFSSTAVSLGYSLFAQTQNGGNWIQLNPTTGITGTLQNSTQVTINTTGLAVGTYQGTITATSTSTLDSVVVPVTLTITSTSTLSISPSTLQPFLFQVGGSLPAVQTLTVSSATTTSFSVGQTATWVSVSPLSGTVGPGSPLTLSVGANPSGLFPSTYDASITLTPSAGVTQQVPVRLVVSNNALLTATPRSLSFVAGASGQPPASQTVQVGVTGTGAAIPFSISANQNWISVITNQNFAGSGSPATLTVSVNQSTLAVGTYNGTITITPTNGDNYTQSVDVTLTVGTSTQISAGPASLYFAFQTTRQPPGPQQISIQSTGQATTFTVTTFTDSCGSGWLLTPSVSSNLTPATMTVNVNAPGLPSGTCRGHITVTPASGSAIDIPIRLAISSNALLTVSQSLGFGYANVAAGQSGPQQTLSLGSTDNSSVSFSVAPSTFWLGVSGGTTTPQTITAFYQTAGLSPGSYGASLTITSAAIPEGSFSIPVTLIINPNITVSVSPSSLDFSMGQGGTVPASKNLTLSNSGGTPTPTYTASISSSCSSLLSVSPTSGLASGTLTVSVLSNTASVGTYNCQVILSYSGASTQGTSIPVTLTITSPRTLNVPSTPLTFNYQLTQSQPASQTIRLTDTGGAVQFTVGTTSTPSGWLSTDTTTGNTPKDVVVTVNTAGLSVGTYSGTITISAPGVLANPVAISVTLNVTAAPSPQPVTITSTASNLAGAISPGALITIKGTLLGPTNPPNNGLFTVNAQGRIDSTLYGVRVLFDGIPGTPIYVSATQINVFAPYELAGRLSTNVTIEYNSIASSPISVRVTDAAPAIFTQNQQGFGPSATLNQNGTVNGPPTGQTLPAAVNTIIAVYATGGGQTNPPSSTGGVTPASLPLRVIPPVGSKSATIGGIPAEVVFAGAAPGLAAGVEQWNIRVPTPPPGTSLSGTQPVVITVNGVSSPAGPTVTIQ